MTEIVNDIFHVRLDIVQTLGLAVIVLLIGMFITDKIKFLNKFCIPAPVIGGILFSIITLIGHQTGSFDITVNQDLKSLFMICFFASVGFGADLKLLKSGGKAVVIFLFFSTLLILAQNGLGMGIAALFGENPLLGIAAGSVPLVGGHGTAAAFGPDLEVAGLAGGTTYAIAAATFGVIAGSLIGGPTARRLIEKHKLTPSKNESGVKAFDEGDVENIKTSYLLQAFFQIAVSVGLGSLIFLFFKKVIPGITFPAYIGAMLAAVAMRNIFGEKSFAPTRVKEIDALGDIFLQVFLAIALMELRLWELVDLALPLITILVLQALLMYLWATYITFNTMGKDYDAAVMSAGNIGFGLGATSNAMASMNAVTKKYGPSPKAFFIIPIVGSLFIDIINALLITVNIGLVK